MRDIKDFKKKNLILKLDNYRKFIKNVRFIDFYKNHILLVCYSIYFSGYTLKLFREYFCSKFFELYNYKDNFRFVVFAKQIKNYLYNYKVQKTLNKNIVFFFKTFNEISLFLDRVKLLTLSPYYFYPLYFVTPIKNISLSFSLFSKYYNIGEHRYYENHFVFSLYTTIIKKLFINLFLFFSLKIKCQH